MNLRLLVLAAVSASPVFAEGLPANFPLPRGATIEPPEVLAFAEAEFLLGEAKGVNLQRGKRWQTNVALTGVAEGTEGKAVWALLKPALLKAGWKSMFEIDGPYQVTLKGTVNGHEAWAHLWTGDPAAISLTIVEVGGSAGSVTLKPPAKAPEQFKDSEDFPWLSPIKGSKREMTELSGQPLFIELSQDGDGFEQVADSALVKTYTGPAGLSNLEAVTLYEAALKKAGWTVLHASQGLYRADFVIAAHYAKDGRNIWARIAGGGGDYKIAVADIGQLDLAKRLAKDCKATLTGVLFDFNKATLQSASEPVLQQVKAALLANAKLAFVIEGHTDNVGEDAYNLTLSENRANTVMKWLTDHAVPTAQLSAKGFGKQRPVSSNDSPTGRAQNRRVELVCKK